MIRPGDIPAALWAGARQLSDGATLGVLALALAITLALTAPFLSVFLAFAGLLEWLLPASISLPGLGEMGFLGVFTQGLVGKTGWVFWTYVISPIAVAIVGALLDPIVDAVERRHYPALPPARRRGLAEVLGYGLRFLAMMLGVSLLALVLALFTGAAPLVWVAANGYLIAREYFETVALRRMSRVQAAALMRANLWGLWAAGCILALGLSVPFANLLVPVVGVAAFTHLFHRLGSGGTVGR